jgi:hypothetical protein
VDKCGCMWSDADVCGAILILENAVGPRCSILPTNRLHSRTFVDSTAKRTLAANSRMAILATNSPNPPYYPGTKLMPNSRIAIPTTNDFASDFGGMFLCLWKLRFLNSHTTHGRRYSGQRSQPVTLPLAQHKLTATSCFELCNWDWWRYSSGHRKEKYGWKGIVEKIWF